MDGLRWYLLLFGLFVVGGVYLYSRVQRNKIEKEDSIPDELERHEPSLDGEPLPEPTEPGFDDYADADACAMENSAFSTNTTALMRARSYLVRQASWSQAVSTWPTSRTRKVRASACSWYCPVPLTVLRPLT
jgi:hypothetical protein